MRFAILSSGQGWHVSDLGRAASEAGHEAVSVDFRRVAAGVASASDALAGFDAIMVRTMPPGSLEQVVFRMDVLHRLEARDVPVLNPARALETCVDKYLASARLEAAGLRVPRTFVCQNADAALEAYEDLGGDVVVKPLFGSEGRGMLRVSDVDLAWRTFRAIERVQAVLYLQEFIAHPGWDLRVFVLGNRVLGAMRRRSHGAWRTNVAQGGQAEPVGLTGEQERLAVEAANAVGAAAAGIDLLPGPMGDWYVLEVNAVPGWRALAPVIQTDVAKALVHFLAEACSTPPTPARSASAGSRACMESDPRSRFGLV
jgi:ribosomal protein S6--L-glutamate ligase